MTPFPSPFSHPRLSQTLARGITKAGVATEMVDLLSADTQELVEIVGRNSGLVVMAPPSDAAEAQASLATVLSAVNPKKQKVRTPAYSRVSPYGDGGQKGGQGL